MATTPDTIVLPITPFTKSAVATAAETAFHNPTGMVTIVDNADNTNGLRLTKVEAINRGATGGALVYAIYKKIATTYTLIKAIEAVANTPSASVAPKLNDFGYSDYNPLTLAAGEGLAFSTSLAVTNGAVGRVEGMAY